MNFDQAVSRLKKDKDIEVVQFITIGDERIELFVNLATKTIRISSKSGYTLK